MVGKTISHYKILEKLGGGGMGVVYRAEDTQLKRVVALKFLPPELTRDSKAKERFVQEAQAASALDHPNICSIHEIGEHEGQTFIVMGYYEGETLKRKIERGPLPIDEAIDIASQVARGLAKAHEAGIVHRDITPANVMVMKDGVAKILDFGLAKVSGHTLLTKSGTTLGTVAYMSPQQARGQVIDSRSDIWSLGVTFYEMVTGKRPFNSDYEQALVYSILNEDPRPMRQIRTDVPRPIENICSRAMAKDPGDRYQTAAELIADLESYKAGTQLSQRTRTISGRKRRLLFAGVAASVLAIAIVVVFSSKGRGVVCDRVAVLPFHNLSKDSTGEILADGMSWEIIEKLQHVASLKVPSVKATMIFKGSSASYAEIARELGATALVHGSIFHLNNRVRVIANLIDPSTDGTLWSESYNGNVEDILDLQSKIAQGLVRAVQVEVTHDEVARLSQSRKVDPRAYELYLKARQTFYTGADERQHRIALELLEQAITLDSSYCPFYPFAVMMYQYGTFFGYWTQAEVMPRMRKAVESALMIDAESASSQMALGILDEAQWDWNGAEAAFSHALKISPGDAQIHQAYANMLQWRGRFDEAIARMNQAYEMDPSLDPQGYWMAATYVNARRFDQAIEKTREFLQRFPGDPALELILGFAFAQKGACDSASGYLERSLTASSHDSWIGLNCAQMFGICGQEQRARELLNHYLAMQKGRAIELYNVAATYAILRDTSNAYSWLERAYRDRSQSLNGLKIDIAWDSQHSNPRYQDMLRRVGLDK